MGKFASIVMYVLWIAAIIFLLTATFTSFQFEDINLIAGVLLFFAFINSFFILVKPGRKQHEDDEL